MTDLAYVTLAGNVFAVKPMTDGQIESMFRIRRSLTMAGDFDTAFYGRQIGRFGALLDSLFTSDEDREKVDDLFLTGQTSTSELLQVLLAAYNKREEGDAAAEAVGATKKPTVKAIKRAPAKKAPAKRAGRAK